MFFPKFGNLLFAFFSIWENKILNSQNAIRIILDFDTEGGYLCNRQHVDFDAQKQLQSYTLQSNCLTKFLRKMKKIKQTAILRIFLFCIASFSIQAQNGNVKCVISYDTKTTNYVRCAKGEERLLNEFDRIGMRKIEEEDSYTIKILANNDRETTISHIKTNRFPSWITVTAKTVIDKNGVKTYDRDGKLLTNIPHSPKALESYNAVKDLAAQNSFQNVPEFRRMRNDEMAELRGHGVKIKNYPDGKIHIRDNDKEVLYDSLNKVIENRQFEGKDLVFSLQQKFQTNRTGENQIYNLDNAAGYIQGKILNTDPISTTFGITNKSNNFIIAHSQGGLVARAVDRLYTLNPWLERRINGIVTFGTPHQGAQILNNTSMFSGFVDGSCTELTAGPAEEEVETRFWLDLITSGEEVRTILDPICKLLGGAAPLAFNDFTQPITEDYKVGAAPLASLNSFQSTANKVAFYGIEDDQNTVWRVMHNVLSKKPNEYEVFSADDDNDLVNKVNMNLLKYQNKVTLWQNQYNSLASQYCNWWQWILAPNHCIYVEITVNNSRNEAKTIRDQWQRGVNWWNSANDKYKTIIGANTYTPTGVTVYECDCSDYDYNGIAINSWSTSVTDPNDCVGNNWMQSCNLTGNNYQEMIANSLPSDGVVLVQSASNFPGCIYTKEMIGSNHQQMRNDSNTKDRLNELYDGQYGTYFYTSPR